MKCAQSKKDKFKRLCHIKADISGAGYTSKSMGATKTAYSRNYEIILLVGLTELKVQVSWIDSKTVRAHLVVHVARIYLIWLPHTRI